MKHKIFSHTSLLIILSVILTFLAAGTVMYNRYDIYMKQGVRDEAAYILSLIHISEPTRH